MLLEPMKMTMMLSLELKLKTRHHQKAQPLMLMLTMPLKMPRRQLDRRRLGIMVWEAIYGDRSRH
jgi:hypothetical protein